jgi:glucosylceramidase
MITAAKNPDGTIAVVVFNEGETPKNLNLTLNGISAFIQISGQAIQTIIIPN